MKCTRCNIRNKHREFIFCMQCHYQKLSFMWGKQEAQRSIRNIMKYGVAIPESFGIKTK